MQRFSIQTITLWAELKPFGFVVAPGGSTLAVAVVLLGLGMGFFAVVDPRFIDSLAEAERGAGFGLVRTVYLIVGSAGSLGVGVFADVFGWAVAFLILSALLGVAFLTLSVNWLLDLGY